MQYDLLLIIAIFLSVIMTLAWLVERRTGKSGWIDSIWSFSVGAGATIAVIFSDGAWERRAVILILILLWSGRLGAHIAQRSLRHGEDPRYAKLIEEWGENASLRLWKFLQIQAVAAFVLVLAVYLATLNYSGSFTIIDLFAISVIIIAIGGEAVSDAQLARFRKTPQAKTEICEEGFWAYSRHPNYFFEWLFWCGWPLMALNTLPSSWLSLLAPIQMYWLLVHVSGIPPLEQHMLRSRGEKFRDLQQRVNVFFPWPGKKAQ